MFTEKDARRELLKIPREYFPRIEIDDTAKRRRTVVELENALRILLKSLSGTRLISIFQAERNLT